jgi:hypothetical protein
MNTETLQLSAEDLPILIDVLDANSSMHNSVYAVKLIEQRFTYPIDSLDTLMRAFDGREHIMIRDCHITPEDVRRFLPESCFPIDGRQALITQLILAFEREHMSVISRLAKAQGHQIAWELRNG